MHPLIIEHRHCKTTRGLDPSEVVREHKAILHCDGPADPPGESPSDHPVMGLDVVSHSSGSSGGNAGGSCGAGRPSYRSVVKWVDSKSVDLDNIDYGVLMDYELLTDSSANKASTMTTVRAITSTAPSSWSSRSIHLHLHPPPSRCPQQPPTSMPTQLSSRLMFF